MQTLLPEHPQSLQQLLLSSPASQPLAPHTDPHGSVLQACELGPEQLAPPLAGAGQSQVRVWVPPPQGAEQGPQPHQPPSTTGGHEPQSLGQLLQVSPASQLPFGQAGSGGPPTVTGIWLVDEGVQPGSEAGSVPTVVVRQGASDVVAGNFFTSAARASAASARSRSNPPRSVWGHRIRIRLMAASSPAP